MARRWIRALVITLMLVVGAGAAALVATQTAWFRDWLRGYIVKQANQNLNGRLSIARLGGNLVEHLTTMLFDPLRAEHKRRVAAWRPFQNRPHMLGGSDDQPRVGIADIVDIDRRPDGWIQCDAGKEKRVVATLVDRVDDVLFHRPKEHIAACSRGDLGERCPPGTAADHRDPVQAFTPAPRTFSASGSSGQRARAGTERPSVIPSP